ncbi:phosphate regulon sensor histidine kinase PhoR [Pleionea litopenaei]|uniref:Phosphate regulon sensor protein PhoR n=1 Tax=Pleionea litopenaei TaxID=3070815 RepID=A0AA51RWP5_9GAMM|nr:phosphate regulon sensor histidine kinase PhoR [Pleionea sp. HL-JVS1]WMS88895.1 phosphate regulon sensor histidine kinase PhoR [Pleionea sp. HL-JVS1]
MSSFRYWGVEIWFVSMVTIVAIIIGLFTGYTGEILFVMTASYLAWHLRQIYRLKRWLTTSRDLYPPDSEGIWSDIFHSIYLLQKRNRKSKKRLTRILSEFRSSTAALPDGAIVLGEMTEIIWFNKSAENLIGLNVRKDIGQRITNLIRNPRFVSYLEHGDYTLPVEVTSPIDDDIKLSLRLTEYNKNQRLLMVRNITRLYQLEKIRQDFVANVSHELRTPLTVVNGYVEIFSDSKEQLPTFFHRPVDQMGQQVLRMRSLVDDLLTLSKLESGDEPVREVSVSPSMILKRIVEEAKALSEGKHKITFDSDNDAIIKGNEKELHSAFSNLIFNAVRYTPKGGQIKVTWHQLDDGFRMAVEDNGPGIDAVHLPRLTERFYRIDDGRDRSVGGTGLGLAIVKHILERHGTRLQITSEVGRGSCFYCDFKAVK